MPTTPELETPDAFESADPSLDDLENELESALVVLASVLDRLDDHEHAIDPESETIADAIQRRDTARARLDLFRTHRERRVLETELGALRDAWDETVDGPVPTSPEPVPSIDETDTRTESERLLVAYDRTTSDLRRELDGFRATEGNERASIVRKCMCI